MAPRFASGFWGIPTATIDWCEDNYSVTTYIAEFWNTISNFIFIIPSVAALYFAFIDHMDDRYKWCNGSVLSRKYREARNIFIVATVTYAFGFFLWEIDQNFCGGLKLWRSEVLGPFAPIFELHAWWHLLAGTGTYLSVLYRSKSQISKNSNNRNLLEEPLIRRYIIQVIQNLVV
ncbi:ACER3 [Mytilus edulis]|uniref:Alkaline ceramidase n=1 Tax=Mytilus edulis TaxID=6550 RepID=A0A8S3QIZ1_MYTED|nr:ACER3 [Mytilus edulis]